MYKRILHRFTTEKTWIPPICTNINCEAPEPAEATKEPETLNLNDHFVDSSCGRERKRGDTETENKREKEGERLMGRCRERLRVKERH